MFSTDDTIVAIATPPGRGGIGVVRLSGGSARSIAQHLLQTDRDLEPRHATFVTVAPVTAENDGGAAIDHAVATFFEAPHSYTGEDVVELSTHGSPVVLRTVVAAAVAHGARLAAPGEFTLRAYLNGRLDLTQAEAVADLIDAVTPLQARTAFDQLQGTLTETIARADAALFDLIARLEASVDFPDEGYHFGDPAVMAAEVDGVLAELRSLVERGRRGRLIREGLQVAIVGAANAGKSSLFNALVGTSRAIVTDVPGTTRDLVTERIDLNGYRVTLTDTAGLRESGDPIEAEGMARSRRAAGSADLTLFVADGSKSWDELMGMFSADGFGGKLVLVRSKSDLVARWSRDDEVAVSAVTGAGLEALRTRILTEFEVEAAGDRPEITNVRHLALVDAAILALARAKDALSDGRALPEEFVLADLQEARTVLDEIVGKRTPEDILNHIFTRFCIGK